MSASEGVGGLFGSLIVFGVGMWGVKKIGEALDSDKELKNSALKNTEPFN